MHSIPSGPTYAAVELGSDGFRLHVASCADGAVHVLASLCEPIRLAAGIGPDGCLDAGTMGHALACLRRFRLALAPWTPRALRVVATAALRTACNAPAFLPAAGAAIGHPVEVIGGEEEGRLIYLGVTGALGDALGAPHTAPRRLVLDIGTGSTELVLGRGCAVELVQSFGVGTWRQGLAFFGEGLSETAFEAALASARSRFADAGTLAGMRGWQRAYGACGTVRALAALLDAPVLDGAALATLRRRLLTNDERIRAPLAALPMRAPQLAGGLAMLTALVERLGIETVLPVRAGLRAGVIRDLHARAQERGARTAPYPESA